MMMRVIVCLLVLQESGCVRLEKDYQNSNTSSSPAGFKKWLKIAGVVKTAYDVGQNYKNAAYVHVGDVADLKMGNHDRQADLEHLADEHKIAYAVVNINLAAAEDFLCNKADDKVDQKVRQAQRKFGGPNLVNAVMRYGIDQLGDDVKQRISDNMEALRHEADIQLLAYHHKNQAPTVVATGDKQVASEMKKTFGLNANGQLAFYHMVNQMEDNAHAMNELAAKQRDWLAVSNDASQEMAEHFDEPGVEKGYEVLLHSLAKTRESIVQFRDAWMMNNWKPGKAHYIHCKGELICAEEMFTQDMLIMFPNWEVMAQKNALKALIEAQKEREKYTGLTMTLPDFDGVLRREFDIDGDGRFGGL